MERTIKSVQQCIADMCRGDKLPRLVAIDEGVTFNTESGELRAGTVSINILSRIYECLLEDSEEWNHNLESLRLTPVTPGCQPITAKILRNVVNSREVLLENGFVSHSYAIFFSPQLMTIYTIHNDDVTELRRIKLRQDLRHILAKLGKVELARDPNLFDGDYITLITEASPPEDNERILTLLSELSTL